MFEALFGAGPLAGIEGEHGDEPVGEALGNLGIPLILFGEDVVQAPGLEFRDVAELT